ncbi:predicted protein [Streptomyces sp. C]|nr:predicted protein [Streptomyces sp. C]
MSAASPSAEPASTRAVISPNVDGRFPLGPRHLLFRVQPVRGPRVIHRGLD